MANRAEGERGGTTDALMMQSRRFWSALAFVLCVVHFASFDFQTQPLVTDVRYFVYYAWQLTEGAIPHVDFFENKPQLPVFLGALLYRTGELLDTDPLYAIRVGYLGVAAVAGWLHFWIFRQLAGGSGLAGILGLLAYCSFGLLGLLPAIGNIPKLLMAVSASSVALLVYRRRWFGAGVGGAFAFLDWQIGALVWLAAGASAAAFAPSRWGASWRLAAGGAVGLAPFGIYYAATGALTATFDQVVTSTFFRGSSALQSGSVSGRIERIAALVERACPEQQWLFYASFAGVAVLGGWLLRERNPERLRLVLPLGIYHLGVAGFALLDFQAYGDLFVLLHSAAFFLGLAWLAVLAGSAAVLARHCPGSARAWRLGGLALLVLALLVARPGVLRPGLAIETETVRAGATLADQREVAAAIAGQTEGLRFAPLESSELLFLMRRPTPLPTLYWGRAVRAYYQESPREAPLETARRVLMSADPDVYIAPQRLGARLRLPGRDEAVEFASKNGRYAVTLRLR